MSKLVKTMITSLAIILIGGTVTLIIILYVTGNGAKSGAESIEKIVENSYETPEITTDLKDGSFVRIQFQILTDGKHAKKELTKRDFQLKNILIKELAKLDEEAFKEEIGRAHV